MNTPYLVSLFANLLWVRVNLASYPQPDGKLVVAYGHGLDQPTHFPCEWVNNLLCAWVINLASYPQPDWKLVVAYRVQLTHFTSWVYCEWVNSLLCDQVNFASYPQRNGKWVVAYGLQGEGLVGWLGRWYVCWLRRVSTCSLAMAMDGRMMLDYPLPLLLLVELMLFVLSTYRFCLFFLYALLMCSRFPFHSSFSFVLVFKYFFF